ncbi:glycosyltransferase family 2 protein [Cyanobium sp. NS01]|uniref:glycosyltransferase family 2 protein n=1 Tax=Cyanobium sp. NS01 TaxID=261284 RepID=UPI001646DFA8|nr:glycosyltransferase [Cyanobium sp. NS01]QNI69795.1 glycosyl transferase/ family 2 [Cyanobium sp. NS01]
MAAAPPDLVWLPEASRRLLQASRLMGSGEPGRALQQLLQVAEASPGLRPLCTRKARQALIAQLERDGVERLRTQGPLPETPEALLAWVLAHPAHQLELSAASPSTLRLGLLHLLVWDSRVVAVLDGEAPGEDPHPALLWLDGQLIADGHGRYHPLNGREEPQARLERGIRLALGRDWLLGWHRWPWLPGLAIELEAPLEPTEHPRHWQEARRRCHENLLQERRRLCWSSVHEQSRDDELVSVVIPVWGAGTELGHCLKHLGQMQGSQKLEILLVDNGNGDAGTCAVLDEAPRLDRRVRVLRQPSNFGFALGCNLGFASSRGSRVLFLNSDARMAAGALPPLLSALEDPRCRGAQPALLTPAGQVQCLGVVFGQASPLGLALHAGAAAAPLLQRRRTPAATAACLLLRAREFAAVQGFDVGYLNGQEDTDLCHRLRQRFGGDFSVEPDSLVIHPEGSSPGRYRFIEANRSRLIARWPHPEQDSLASAAAADALELVGYLDNDRPGRPAWLRSPRPVVRPCRASSADAATP